MTAKDNTPETGKESSDEQSENQPDWERIARRELWVSLQDQAEFGVGDSASAVAHAVRDGDDPLQQFQGYRKAMLDFEQRARESLCDIGELDQTDPEERVIVGIMCLAWYAIVPEMDVERLRDELDRMNGLVDQLEEERDGD